MRRELIAAVFLLAACAPAAADEPTGSQALEVRPTHGSLGGRICSWNIRRLGHFFDDRPKNLEATAQVMKDHCDVVVVQEVMQMTGGVTAGYDLLLDTLGFSWDGLLTEKPRPDTTSGNSERYAFYWRRSVATPCEGWTGGARYIDDEDDAFLREPAWTCLKVRDHAKELLLVSYHAIFGTPIERQREVATLDDDRNLDGKKDDIVRAMRASRPGADVVLLGDFNLKPNELAEALPTYRDMTVGTGSTVNMDDEVTDNLYDHAVLAGDESLLETMKPAEVLDVRSYAGNESFFGTMSDHLPIRFTLRQ